MLISKKGEKSAFSHTREKHEVFLMLQRTSGTKLGKQT